MPSYAYDRLTALDNSFLQLEQPNAYMHVASTMTFEAGPLAKPDGGIDVDRLRKMIESVLHMIPRYRQKLQYIPLTDQPVWVDDDRFNIDYHVRHTALPRPGNVTQLKQLSARIMQQHLDRRRPLWEMWVVEGLEDGGFAIISKIHHCMIDGVSGVDIMNILMNPTPEIEYHEAPAFVPRPAPGSAELIAKEMLRYASLPILAAREISYLVTEAKDVRRNFITRARALGGALGGSFSSASSTPINREIGPHRRFDWMITDIEEVRQIRRSLGGSLNDVVLTIVAGAVRRFMQRRLVDPAKLDFRVMAPVSVRTEGEKGQLGNRVSAWIIEMPLGEPDPRKRLAAISRRTNELKEQKTAVAAEILTQVLEWTPSTLLSLGARNSSRLLPFNLVVTNVPGPQVPMYMMGARMKATYPHVPLLDNLGLGIALMSCDGQLCWGFNADYDLLPDLGAFIKGINESLEELKVLAAERVEGSGPKAAAVTIEAPAPASTPKRKAKAPVKNGKAAAPTTNGSTLTH
ncbi:MAG: diacylglycerol O-acyltransferase [Hyphomicrobiaceae bacterium]